MSITPATLGSSQLSEQPLDEQTLSASGGQGAGCSTVSDLAEGEVMRIELYEEVPEVTRKIVVREMVQVRKVLIQESLPAHD